MTAGKQDEHDHSRVEHLEKPAPLVGEPALIIGAVVAVADVLVTIPSLPAWLQAALIAVITAGGAVGIRSKVTPGG